MNYLFNSVFSWHIAQWLQPWERHDIISLKWILHLLIFFLFLLCFVVLCRFWEESWLHMICMEKCGDILASHKNAGALHPLKYSCYSKPVNNIQHFEEYPECWLSFKWKPALVLQHQQCAPDHPALHMSSFCSSPVVLYVCCLISDGCQVHFGPIPVRQTHQLLDHIVSHLLHELQGLHIVTPRGEDLVQPCKVLVQAALHAAHGASYLEGTRGEKGERWMGLQCWRAVMCQITYLWAGRTYALMSDSLYKWELLCIILVGR